VNPNSYSSHSAGFKKSLQITTNKGQTMATKLLSALLVLTLTPSLGQAFFGFGYNEAQCETIMDTLINGSEHVWIWNVNRDGEITGVNRNPEQWYALQEGREFLHGLASHARMSFTIVIDGAQYTIRAQNHLSSNELAYSGATTRVNGGVCGYQVYSPYFVINSKDESESDNSSQETDDEDQTPADNPNDEDSGPGQDTDDEDSDQEPTIPDNF
jgi:hypothetical protein